MKIRSVIAVMALMVAASSAVAAFDEVTIQNFRAQAELGNRASQFLIGGLYEYGDGLPQSYKEAFKWYTLSAEQGFSGAQSALGEMYAKGKGVPQNFKLAYVWFSLAAANENSAAPAHRDSVAQKLTPAELAEAQELAMQYFEKYQSKP